MNTKYTIRINYKNGSHRFVKWCDEHWFESTNNPNYVYNVEQAEEICWLMSKHYVSNLTIIGTDGSTKEMGLLNRKYNKHKTIMEEKPKKSIFSLNMSMFK